MSELFDIEIQKDLLIGSFIIFSTTIIIFLKLVPLYFTSFFGECVANKKSSKFHFPMLRGLGIIFPFVLILSAIIWGSIFNIFEIIIITLSTMIGFWDDKYGLKQKQKLLAFLLIGFIWSLHEINFLIIDFESFFKFFACIFIFIFLVLFFNQIDGINGLATITFLISILCIHINVLNLILFLPLFLSVMSYFFVNLKGGIGIQGDAGSFFMGSFMAILFTKTIEWPKIGIVFLILGPIIFDVCATTMVRIYHKIDLTIGHRNNLYQKLVSKYQSHVKVTLFFGALQLLFNYFLYSLLDINTVLTFYLILFSIGCFFMLTFFIIAYFIHNKKILKSD